MTGEFRGNADTLPYIGGKKKTKKKSQGSRGCG
jgi:hypothetical protein